MSTMAAYLYTDIHSVYLCKFLIQSATNKLQKYQVPMYWVPCNLRSRIGFHLYMSIATNLYMHMQQPCEDLYLRKKPKNWTQIVCQS